MIKIYINPGHDTKYDSGAVNPVSGLRECDVAKDVALLVEGYLNNVGYETRVLQSDNLCNDSIYEDRDVSVCDDANEWDADIFVSIHCNAFNCEAKGTETLMYRYGSTAEMLAKCVQNQIVESLGTVDRGIKARPGLIVLKATDMPAILVELAFIDNDEDAELLSSKKDEFARAIARGITDYFSSLF